MVIAFARTMRIAEQVLVRESGKMAMGLEVMEDKGKIGTGSKGSEADVYSPLGDTRLVLYW